MPFPGLALYSASKAFLRSFSVAFAKEVCEHGIPRDGRLSGRRGDEPLRPARGSACASGCSSRPTAARGAGLQALWRGRRTCVPDWWNRLWIPLCKVLPLVVLRPVRRSTMRFQK